MMSIGLENTRTTQDLLWKIVVTIIIRQIADQMMRPIYYFINMISNVNFFWGTLSGVNCKRLMKYHVDIINGLINTFIETSKGILSNEYIYLLTNQYVKHIVVPKKPILSTPIYNNFFAWINDKEFHFIHAEILK